MKSGYNGMYTIPKAIIVNIISGGGRGTIEGLEPPNFPQRGQSPSKIYVCDVINIS